MCRRLRIARRKGRRRILNRAHGLGRGETQAVEPIGMAVVRKAGGVLDGGASARQVDECLGQRLPVHERCLARRAVENLCIGRSIPLLDHPPQSVVGENNTVNARRVAKIRVPSVGSAQVVGEQVAIAIVLDGDTADGEAVGGGGIGGQERASPTFLDITEGVEGEQLLPDRAAIHGVPMSAMNSRKPAWVQANSGADDQS